MISPNSIQEVLNIANVQDIVQDYVNLRRRGINMIGLCPFHNEKTPSFTVSPSKNIYKCFGCGKGGNAVQFLMDHEQMTFPESIRLLAKRYGIELNETEVSEDYKEEQQLTESLYLINDFAKDHFKDQLWKSDEGKSIGLSYYKRRGFLESTIQAFELGYAVRNPSALSDSAFNKNYNKEHIVKLGLANTDGRDFFRERVIFPIHNLSGKVIGFGGRTLSSNKKIPKYLNSPESEIYNKRKSLYGLYFAKKAIRSSDECILVEGYTDTISLHQAGVENVVASSGTSLTIDQIKLIKRYTDNIKVLFDGDEAGIKAAMRGMNLILEQNMNIKLVLLPPGEDPDSFLTKLGVTAFKEFIAKEAKDFILFQTQMISEEAGNDPIQKAALLKDIVASISKIPDTIKRSLYIQQCANLLGMSEEILIKESNRSINADIKRKRLEQDRDALRSENQELLVSPKKKTIEKATYRVGESDEHHEENLARLVLTHGDQIMEIEDEKISVIDFIYHNIDSYLSEFSSALYRQIIELTYQQFQTNGKIDQQTFTNHTDENIQNFAVNAMTSPYQFANWQDRGAGLMTQKDPELNFYYDAKKSLIRFILRKLVRKLEVYRKTLKQHQEDGNEEEVLAVLKKVQILQEEKKQLSEQIDTNQMYRI